MANGILNFDPDEVDQDVIDFYGGNAQQIAQPDASYFSEFPLTSTRERNAGDVTALRSSWGSE